MEKQAIIELIKYHLDKLDPIDYSAFEVEMESIYGKDVLNDMNLLKSEYLQKILDEARKYKHVSDGGGASG